MHLMSLFVLPVSHISGQRSDARSEGQSHPIETATSMALCLNNSMACYTDRNRQIRLLRGSA